MDPDAWTQAGNAVFTIPSLVAVCVGLAYGARGRFSGWGKLALGGCLLALLGVSIRVGQWLLAGWTRIPPERYGAWIFEVRDEITAVAALLFSGGCTMFMAGCSRRGAAAFWIVAWLVITVLSATLGYFRTPQ